MKGLKIKDDKLEIFFNEYRLLADICRDFFGHYLKATTLYIIILGALLKFFIDTPSTNSKIVFWSFGFMINVFTIVATLYARKLFRPMLNKSKELSSRLGTEDLHYPAILHIGKALLIFKFLITIAWIFLLLIIYTI